MPSSHILHQAYFTGSAYEGRIPVGTVVEALHAEEAVQEAQEGAAPQHRWLVGVVEEAYPPKLLGPVLAVLAGECMWRGIDVWCETVSHTI